MSIIKYPVSTEKSIRLMESENKIVFMVDRKAKKADIKKELENTFKAKILSVNTSISFKGKKAFVKFDNSTPAIDVAIKLGLM